MQHRVPRAHTPRTGDVVLTAVRDCPLALEHAAETVRRDRDVVVAALRISVKAAGGLSQDLAGVQEDGGYRGHMSHMRVYS